MKKVLLFIFSLCLLCSGCATAGISPATTLTESSQTIVLKTTAEDGNLLLERSFPQYSLESDDQSVAISIETDLQRRIGSWMSPSADLPEYALELYSPKKPWVTWFAKLEGQNKRLDSQVFSLYFEYSEFTGSAHPNTITYSVTYDCKSGNTLALADLLINGHSPQNFASAVNDALSTRTDELYDDYEALVGKSFSEGMINWYLSGEGLCFHFPPYDIGPYSTGVVTVTLPYSQLNGILSTEFLPSK